MKKSKRAVYQLAVAGLLVSVLTSPAAILHRYSFNASPGTTTVADSVGGANGVLAGGQAGNAADFDGAGQLILPGGGGSADPANTIAGYVDLPNHLINGLTNLTFETWVTLYGSSTWQRILDFGVDGTGVEGTSAGNGNYVFISSPADVNLRYAVREPLTGQELTQCTAPSPLPVNTECCVTATYDTINNVARLYVNGVLVSTDDAPTPLSAINDINNWLGRSQWGDPMLSGSYNEFRIYNNALDPVSAAASYLNGVDNPSTDVTSLGALQSVVLTASVTILTVQDTQTTAATANFANLAGIILVGVPGVTYQSSNPSVLTINTNGLITAVGPGTSSVTVSYLGQTSTAIPFTVNPRLEGVVVAGALEVDLRATDLSTDTLTWTNRAAANSTFAAEGTPVYNSNVANGLAGVSFNGLTDDYAGPGASAEISANSDFSIEAWAFVSSPKAEDTLVAWGMRGVGGGDSVLGAGNHAVYGAASFWGGGFDLGWSGPAPVKGAWHYYTLTYNGARVAKVYADGKLKTTLTVPADLSSPAGLPIRVGAQNSAAADGSVDLGQALLGSVALARVHTGLLSDNDVANNFLYGVELTSPGNLNGLVLTFGQTNLPGSHYKTYASVRPNYANRAYLVVNGFSTFSSSDTNVATVDANGYVTAVALGSAQITASYAGLLASNTITVTPPPPTALVHRYSFNETTGTNVADSVGGANGTVRGNGASFGAGQINLPGGTASTADPATIAGYVDLPNNLIAPLVNVTFETWATWQGSGDWQRIFDFGTSNAGEDNSGGEGGYFFLNAQPWRFAVRDIPANGEPIQLNNGAMPVGLEFHVVVVYNFTANTSQMYTNGVLAVSSIAPVQVNSINYVNDWLGRSQWPDPVYQGSINEFRIYEGALTAAQVAADYAAGPDALPALTAPSLSVSLSGGNMVISWPVADSAGFVLQAAGTLATGTTWTNVPTAPVISGPNYQVTVPPSGSQLFFKLTK